MMKTHKRRVRSRVRGFTLLEVLMVVVIIGLLAAFIVPNLFGTEGRVKEDLTRAAVTSGLSGTLDRYRIHIGHYPMEEEGGLKALLEKPDREEVAKKWGGPYLKKAGDLNDAWSNPYIYKCPGQYNQDSYDLSSPGKDGQEGTEDDITNWEKT